MHLQFTLAYTESHPGCLQKTVQGCYSLLVAAPVTSSVAMKKTPHLRGDLTRRPLKCLPPPEESQSVSRRSYPPGGKSSGIFGDPDPPARQQKHPPGGQSSNIFGAAESPSGQNRGHPNKPKDNLSVVPEPESSPVPEAKVSPPEVKEAAPPPRSSASEGRACSCLCPPAT
ncbi:hypothetical protein CesoFtcFv8_018925 [Champsocephalus esox]|uniref:Jupiter microtubule associated homolog 2 n=1 Tax=Champsocephalus esox TaxID=159716 RepID=A0AAN8BH96_9TELE|nr:hypothetical protein CesoFtcFv8_018925 [Champsocephalus esox]